MVCTWQKIMGDEWVKLTGTNDTINYCTVWGMCEKDGSIYFLEHFFSSIPLFTNLLIKD